MSIDKGTIYMSMMELKEEAIRVPCAIVVWIQISRVSWPGLVLRSYHIWCNVLLILAENCLST